MIAEAAVRDKIKSKKIKEKVKKKFEIYFKIK